MFLFVKCLIRKKEFLGCFLICILLFGLLFYSLFLSFSINNYVINDKEQIEYRTLFIDASSSILEKIKLDKNVTNMHFNDDKEYYEVVIDKYANVASFVSFYGSDLSYVETYPYTASKVITSISYFLNGSIALLSLFIIILIIMSILNFTFTFKRDIALYKMIGYNNFILFRMLVILFFLFYTIVYIIGFLIAYLLLFISKYLFLVFDVSIDIIYFNISINLVIILLLLFLILLSILFLFGKISKISPLILFKKSS